MAITCCGRVFSKWTKGFMLAMGLCVIGGSLHRGFSITELNPIETEVTKWLNHSFVLHNETVIHNGTETQELYTNNYKVTELWSVFVGIRFIGQIVACLTIAPVADYIGRKNTIALIVCGCAFLSLLQNVGVYIASYALLMVGRAIDGFGDGVIAMLIPLHFSEIAPTADRGRVTSCHALFLTLGWWLPPILSLPSLLGSDGRWPYIFVFNALLTLPLLFLSCQPEGPKFILLQKNDVDGAKKAIHYYQGADVDVDHFIDMYRSQQAPPAGNPLFRMFKLLRLKHLRLNLFLTIALAFGMCFAGIGPVTSYLTSLTTEAGVSNLDAKLCMLGVAMLRTVLAMALVVVADKISRRKLLLISLWTILALIGALIVFQAIDEYAVDKASGGAHGFLVVVKVFILFIWGGIVALLNALCPLLNLECYPQNNRAAAGATYFLISYSMNYIVTTVFPLLQLSFGIFSVFILMPFLLPAALYLSFRMPETTRREISVILRDINPEFIESYTGPNEKMPLVGNGLNDQNDENAGRYRDNDMDSLASSSVYAAS